MLEAAGVHTIALDLPPRRSLSGAWRLWHKVRRHGFSIIHQHAGGPLITLVVRLATGAKIALHVHGRVLEAQGFALAPIHVKNADVVIATSGALAQYVTGATPRVIYAGVCASRLPERSAISGRGETVIGVGCRLAPIKAVPNLVRAFALLQADFPQTRLEIAGDGPERGKIAELVSELGLGDRISLLGWKSDFDATLVNWDIFVLPSLEESFGIAAIEAMAAGLPVVASAVGGLTEIVQDGETGWLVRAGDPQQLAERLSALLSNPEERLRMGVQGQTYARTHFSEDRMVTEIAEIYDELTQSRPTDE
jgi:glycosyltransferase involved in cell wall biosynthesis